MTVDFAKLHITGDLTLGGTLSMNNRADVYFDTEATLGGTGSLAFGGTVNSSSWYPGWSCRTNHLFQS